MLTQADRLRQQAHVIVEARLKRLRIEWWVAGISALLVTSALAAEALSPEQRMTGDQQFYLAMAAMFVNTVFLILTYLKANATHGLVNSELTEFKRLLQQNALEAQVAARAEGITQGQAREKAHSDPPIYKEKAAEPKKKDKP